MKTTEVGGEFGEDKAPSHDVKMEEVKTLTELANKIPVPQLMRKSKATWRTD